jgi:hypothetical protein
VIAADIARMTAHEFRRLFPAVDRLRRLLGMTWREYQIEWALSQPYRYYTSVSTANTDGSYEGV